MKDRVKLKKFIQIIGDLIKIEGNEWIVDEIFRTIGEVSSVEEIAKHSVIQNIHEYCIEQKIEQQAIGFYYSFPIQEIRAQLIQDYKKMEHERRRDDFENFCLCLYQQIENITNYLFEFWVKTNWDNEKQNLAFKYWDNTLKEYVSSTKNKSIEDLVFPKKFSEWHANNKFRAILYFFYFDRKVINSGYEFKLIYNIYDEVYQMRNQNHRGGNLNEYQKNVINKIEGNECKYYFKYHGFLYDFLTKIEDNFSLFIKNN